MRSFLVMKASHQIKAESLLATSKRPQENYCIIYYIKYLKEGF